MEVFFSELITCIAGNGSFNDGAPRLSGVDVDHLVVDPSRYSLLTQYNTSFKFQLL